MRVSRPHREKSHESKHQPVGWRQCAFALSIFAMLVVTSCFNNSSSGSSQEEDISDASGELSDGAGDDSIVTSSLRLNAVAPAAGGAIVRSERWEMVGHVVGTTVRVTGDNFVMTGGF